jgi:sugar/nucleoside kinase (ribokinase family)
MSGQLDVVVIGDAILDLIARVPRIPVADESVFGPPMVTRFGGAAGNTAVALARLGLRVGFVGRVGTDDTGASVRADLTVNGIDCGGLVSDAEHGTGAVLALQDDMGGRAMLGLNLDAAYYHLQSEDLRWEPLLHAPCVYVGGFLMVSEPGRSSAFQAMDEATARGAEVYFDPNVRGGRSMVSAERIAAHWEAMQLVTVVVATDEEMALIGVTCAGLDASMSVPLAARLTVNAVFERNDRATLAVLKHGARGATAILRDGTSEHAPAFAIEVVDTIGAGDCFIAALLAARSRGETTLDALRFSNAAAALSTTGIGGRASPTKSEVEAFLAGAGAPGRQERS